MDEKQFTFVWNEFSTHGQKSFKKLWEDNELTDVILLSEDDVQHRCHRVILSSSSEFFRNIFVTNPNPNLLLYLKGIKSETLRILLEFIYIGQCKVNHEDINIFLDTGRDLKILGLVDKLSMEEPITIKDEDPVIQSIANNMQVEDNEEVICKIGYENQGSLDICENKTTEIEKKTVENENAKSTLRNKWHTCGKCYFKSQSRNLLKNHMNEHHDVTLYNCISCQYKTEKKTHLRQHNETKHYTDAKFWCDECDYKAPAKQRVKIHKLRIHQGVRFPCDQCQYTASSKEYVAKHKLKQHKLNE